MDDQSLDTEEFEQIPWSSLMAEQPRGVDRRVYIALGVIGVIVAFVFGSRLLAGESQPVPVAVAPVEPGIDVSVTSSAPTSTFGMVVSEADLMANVPADVRNGDGLLYVAIAEWFVTDYFTTDGSSETQRSLDSVDVLAANDERSPVARPDPGTYVEWARAIAVTDGADGRRTQVKVIFRTITRSDDGYTRDPVAAVSVDVVALGENPGVVGPPVTVPVPTLGVRSPAGIQPVGDTSGDPP